MKRALAAAAAAAAVVAPAADAAAPVQPYRLSFAPREVLFGDPIVADVETIVDPAAVDPRAIRVHTDFRPYRVVSSDVRREAAGRFVRVDFRYRLECLATRCLPDAPVRTILFGPVRITWGRQTQTAFWPKLQLASRVDPRDLARPALRSDVARQPPVTWAVSPSAAVAALVVAAALLLVLPALVLAGVAARAWRRWRTTRLERLSPLERALELLRRASGEAPSRKALERVAHELGDDELAAAARRLAWSRPQPAPGEIDALRSRVEDAR